MFLKNCRKVSPFKIMFYRGVLQVFEFSEIVEEEVVHFVPEEDKMKPVEEESPSTSHEDKSSKDEL